MAAGSPASTHELAQLVQSIDRGKLRQFDPTGDSDVKEYDLRQLKLKHLSIWQGTTDRLVTVTDTQKAAENLTGK